MPNIQEYNAGPGKVTPDQGGQEAFVQSGRRIGTFFHQSGEILGGAIAKVGRQVGEYLDQQQAQEQILDANAKLSTIDTNLGNNWHTTTRDPNFDPNNQAAGQGAIEAHQEATQSLLENVSNSRAREHLLSQVDASNRAFSSRVRADQANLSGAAAEQNYNTAFHNYSQDVYNNPEAFEARHSQLSDSLEAVIAHSPSMNAEQADALRKNFQDKDSRLLALSSAKGLIDADPAQGMKEIQGGRYKDYLGPGELEQLQRYQQSVVRMNTAEQKAVETEQKRQNTDQARQMANDIVSKTIADDGTMRAGPDFFKGVKQYMGLPGADPGTGRSMFDLGERMQQEKYVPIRPTSGVLNGYLQRLGTDNPPTDKEVLSNTEIKGGLTLEESNFIRARMKPTAANKFETEQLSDMRSMIKNQFDTTVPLQAQNEQAAQNWFLKEYQQGISRGWSAQSMTDPTDPHYLMTPDNLKQFKTLKGDALLDAMRAMTGETDKRMGKSITEFMNGQ